MTRQDLFNKGFPTNRIPIRLPSSGAMLQLRETTVAELKSMCKIVIENFDRRNLGVIYDALSDYLQHMILTDGIYVNDMTEFDRLYCLMIFFQMSFYKDPMTYKCENCGVDIVYRYDMSKYIGKMESAFVDEQTVQIPHKGRIYEFKLAWPKVKVVSSLMDFFYGIDGEVTEEMEKTQLGIYYVFTFIRSLKVTNPLSPESDAFLNLDSLDNWQDKIDCINELPSMVVFDKDIGLFDKVLGYFVNRLENCF